MLPNMLKSCHVSGYLNAIRFCPATHHAQIKIVSIHEVVRTFSSGRDAGERSQGTSSTDDMSAVTRRVSPLVTTEWLQTHVRQPPPNFRVLDGSWHLPVSKRSALREFRDSHIPGAQFFDIDECSDKASECEHTIPPPDVFEKYVSKLGIDNNTHVVVYDNNATFGLFSAQRVWWMFRAFGHSLVSVLDGGFPKWVAEDRDTTDEIDRLASPGDYRFKATFDPSFLKTFEQVEVNLSRREFTVMDARPTGRFEGTAPEPRPGIKPGHIPGSVNIPFPSVMNPETKTLKDKEQLREIFTKAGVDLNQPLAASCGSGISGCMLILAAYVCGKDDVSLYDGSWTEWYMRAPSNLRVTAK